MKDSFITRRIDELGRIVIPKEIRYNLGIRNGEMLEIFVDNSNIIIKKYSQLGNNKEFSQKICNVFKDSCNIEVMISDREKIIASTNSLSNKELLNIHKELIDNRENYISKQKESLYGLNGFYIILPIITSNDCNGLVIIVVNELSNNNINYARLIQKLLSQKLEI